MYAYAVTADVLRKVTPKVFVNGVYKGVAEPLVTEILVKIDVKTAAVTVYVCTVNLKAFEVQVSLISLKMFLYTGADSGIVRLGLQAQDRQYDGQRRQQSSHAPEHNP
jgi:hypothetical protein